MPIKIYFKFIVLSPSVYINDYFSYTLRKYGFMNESVKELMGNWFSEYKNYWMTF